MIGSGRYTKVADGLRISNISEADNGDYTCRAEVELDGRYDERRINVQVHSRPIIRLRNSTFDIITLNFRYYYFGIFWVCS